MDMRKFRGRMAELGISQQDLADTLGINATLLNHILKGRRQPHPGFEEQAPLALQKVWTAKEAAQATYERVLAGEGVGEEAG